MAKIGAKYIKMAPITTADTATTDAAYTYSSAKQLAELATANWTPTVVSAAQYGDNVKVEDISVVQGGTLALEVTDLSPEDRVAVYGSAANSTAETTTEAAGDVAPLVGVACIKCGIRFNVAYFEGWFFPKCKAVLTAESLASQNGSITVTNDAVTFNVIPTLHGGVVRVLSDRFDTEAEAVAWCEKRLGKPTT